MIKNFFKIALRNLSGNKTISLINIGGLAIGMACVILITQWVIDELGYDTFHKNRENIYRIYNYTGNYENKDIETPAPLGPALCLEIPEVTNYVRYTGVSRVYLQYDEQVHYENKVVFADASLFEIFSFPLLVGDPKTMLEEPSDIVISESIAKKYFGDDDPINKTVLIEGQYPVTVKGVFNDVPKNSSLDFNAVISFKMTEYVGMGQNWGDFNFATYIQLADNANVTDVIAKVNQSVTDHLPYMVDRGVKFHLQNLSEIHLDASVDYEDEEDLIVLGNKTYVYIFSIVAILILIIACANFINLTTAQAATRYKEIGIKKAIGAARKQIFVQFIGESVIFTFVALVIAVVLAEISLPFFNEITLKNISIDYTNYKVILSLITILIVSGLLAGFYPAFVLSSYKPAHIISGKGKSKSAKGNLRKIFIAFQFAVSIALISCFLIFNSQFSFIQNKNLGFDKDNIIYLPVKGKIAEKYDLLKTKLLQEPDVSSVTIKNSLPVRSNNNINGLECDGNRPPENVYFETTSVGYDYFKTLNLSFKSGRAFSQEFPTDRSGYILNDEAVRLLNLENPVGKLLKFFSGNAGPIIGVVNNANFRSLHQLPRPRVYYFMEDYEEADIDGVVLIKTTGTNVSQTIATIETFWKAINDSVPFEYGFLDAAIENQYQFEKRVKIIFNYFTFFALFVSILGLFGRALFSTERRIKEIGIRKVLGASVLRVVFMLTKDFTRWVIIANLIAWPIAWYAMHKWLENFAYRIDLTIWPFLLSGLLALIIALLTVSWQAIRAATANPVEALKYE